ncbi:hypothetical protein Poly41_49080 [Novipirellula artificiosorum]|uniref:Uncharacterized protein n=1 Tax=Novipirellula artificiosorum TaxID=2528016 RepID=A0A5C6DB62_9BACT|nr:hypothetical protein Poly41_49080 [Novipirellula artificiosorum]
MLGFLRSRPVERARKASPPGETASATLTDSSGRQVANYIGTQVSVDRQEIKPANDQAGWWQLNVLKASTGVLDKGSSNGNMRNTQNRGF